MTSITATLQRSIARRPAPPVDPDASGRARRVLAVAAVVSATALAVAVIGLVIDPIVIEGAPGWVKPAKFGIAITAYLLTLRWIAGKLTGHRRLLTVTAWLTALVFAYETIWIDVQVIRGTTSHFNETTTADAIAYFSAGGAISLVFVATAVVAVLALRERGLDLGVAAGLRWGLGICVLGMAEAVSMIVNSRTRSSGGHTVGAPDGGPGMWLTDWSLEHGDLRIWHFVGLHALQALPILAWALLRFTRLDERTRRDLMRVAGVGAAAVVVLVWWQAERGQALLRPDALTLGGAAAVALAGTAAVAAVLLRHRRA